MPVIRSAALLALVLSLSLTGCQDARRDTVREWLQAHPPEGFEVASIPERIIITRAAGGASESVVPVRYRLARPTVEIRDLFTLPRGTELAKRIAAVRGWAISSLPAGDSTREAIASASATARAAFPTKRQVTPKGTEVEDLVVVTLGEESGHWQVTSSSFAVSVPGAMDQNSRVPFEDSPEVAAKFDELEIVVQQLEASRQKYLADRQRAAEHSLAKLRGLLKPGHTFEGQLPDHTPVRLVVSLGADSSADSSSVVLSIERTEHSSARYSGAIAQQPSGEAVWRAAHVTTLSDAGGPPLTDASSRPILTLAATENGLAAEVKSNEEAPIAFKLTPTGVVDLIPDASIQNTGDD